MSALTCSQQKFPQIVKIIQIMIVQNWLCTFMHLCADIFAPLYANERWLKRTESAKQCYERCRKASIIEKEKKKYINKKKTSKGCNTHLTLTEV